MKKGFTLIELVMVIVILGILAATALPRFIDLSSKAKISAAKGSIGTVRAAIAIQYADNAVNGVTPLFPATIAATLFSDGKIPSEPFLNSNAVAVQAGAEVAPAAATGGWLYNSTTGRVWINTNGNDGDGTAISTY
ncbi:MAG: prepilin-type N-terminal cleavage/methylation domain-containing protein [Candidatus Margulisiibacteriota bacterium]